MKSENCLNPNSIVPLYMQVLDCIEKKINEGEYGSSGKLPKEADLSEEFSVSRITIRRAVDELVLKGIVEKKQGKGTFIVEEKFKKRLDMPMSFTEVCQANGLSASAKIIEAGICTPKSLSVRKMLGLKETDKAVRIKRLRLADNRPLVLEDNFFPIEYSYLLSIDLEKQSIYDYLKNEKGIFLKRTSTKIRLIKADAELAQILNVKRNAPELVLEGLVVDALEKPVHTSYQVGYGENFEIIVK